MEGPERTNSQYRAYIDEAAKAHLAALHAVGMRGWHVKSGTRVKLSQDEAEECVGRAFERFMNAVTRRNETVMALILDHDPGSKNVFRMLRHMFQWSAYDMIRSGRGDRGGDVPESSLPTSPRDDGGDTGGRLEELLHAAGADNPLDKSAWMEAKISLAIIVEKAKNMGLLDNEKRQFLLKAVLQGQDNDEIAEALGLDNQQVGRLQYKLREALREALHALQNDTKEG